MRADHEAAPLVVVRSEAGSGLVGLRLIGELDLNTVELLDAELARTREKTPPSVIDLTELRFLDLIGLRALLRAVGSDAAGAARLVGATGIVRRLIELAQTLEAETVSAAWAPFPCEPATGTDPHERESEPAVLDPREVNGSRRGVAASTSHATANGDAA